MLTLYGGKHFNISTQLGCISRLVVSVCCSIADSLFTLYECKLHLQWEALGFGHFKLENCLNVPCKKVRLLFDPIDQNRLIKEVQVYI